MTSRRSRSRRALSRFIRKQPLGSGCALLIVLIVVVAVFADVVAPYSATKNNVGPSLVGPSTEHLFGTDNFGRDIFSRVIYGARISLMVGLGATLVSVLISTTIGGITGYTGGVIDYFVQRLVDVAQAIPPTIMLISTMIVLGPSINNVIIALAVRGGLTGSRVIRGVVIGLRAYPFIESARAIGASHSRVLLMHLLPNVMPTAIVLISIGIGGNIVAEASLSFLGYGVPPPSPTWGGMMSAEGRLYMLINPWILIFPTIALSVVVYTMNMFGDALRDEIDPRMRGSR
jgi:peptide/nickel transport system permease protein